MTFLICVHCARQGVDSRKTIHTIGSIHKLRRQARREGGLAKCLFYYISLCSKLVYGGGWGQNWQNLA